MRRLTVELFRFGTRLIGALLVANALVFAAIEGADPVPYCPPIYDHDGPGGLAVGAEPCLGAVMTRMINIAVDALLMGPFLLCKEGVEAADGA